MNNKQNTKSCAVLLSIWDFCLPNDGKSKEKTSEEVFKIVFQNSQRCVALNEGFSFLMFAVYLRILKSH